MRVILHTCCGICAAGAVEKLATEGHQILCYFYNPNIHPKVEYQRRLEATHRVSQELGLPLVAASYTPEEWLTETSSLKDEPEGGKRCQLCFRMRLEKTYLYTVHSGWDAFATTLAVSPHKSTEVVNRMGQRIGGDKFLSRNFKEGGGFERANQLARQWGLYRQNYCGCIYSVRNSTREC